MSDVLDNLRGGGSAPTANRIGNGMFSTVYNLDGDKDKVIKVGRTLQDAWLYYAAFTVSRRRRWRLMPIIHSVHVDTNEGKFWAVMERLETVADGWITNPSIQTSLSETSRRHRGLKGHAFEARALLRLVSQVQDDLKTEDPFRLDAHADNWMRRKGTPNHILTDPFAHANITLLPHVRRLAAQSRVPFTIH